MKIADLYAKLGLDLNKTEFKTADDFLTKLRVNTASMVSEWKAAEAATRDLHEHFNGVVLGTSRSMRKGADDAIVSWDAWNDRLKAMDFISLTGFEMPTKKGINMTKVWMGALVGLGAAIAAVGIAIRGVRMMKGMIEDTAAAAAKADDLSQKLGISAEAVQELGYAGVQSSTSLDGVADGMAKLGLAAKDAKDGSKEARAAFKSVGVDFKALAKGTLPVDTALAQIADKFAAMPDSVAKMNLATKLFGKSGKDLIPFLNQGAAGIADLRREAHEMGAVIDGKTAKELKGLGDEAGKVKIQLEGMRNDAVKALLPDLLALAKGAQVWLKANRGDVVKSLTATMKILIGTVKVAGVVFKGLVKTMAFMSDHWTATKIALAHLLGPIGSVIWVLTQLGGVAVDVGRSIVRSFDGAGGRLRSIVGSIASFFRAAAAMIRESFGAAIAWVESKIDDLIQSIKDAANWVKRNTVGRAESLIDGAVDIGHSAASVVSPLVSSAPSRSLPAPATNFSVGDMQINVHSNSSDPAAVAVHTRTEFEALWARKMQQAVVGSGIA